jgi:hypothetical protein
MAYVGLVTRQYATGISARTAISWSFLKRFDQLCAVAHMNVVQIALKRRHKCHRGGQPFREPFSIAWLTVRGGWRPQGSAVQSATVIPEQKHSTPILRDPEVLGI